MSNPFTWTISGNTLDNVVTPCLYAGIALVLIGMVAYIVLSTRAQR